MNAMQPIFEIERNAVAETAWAAAVFSSIPYIGVLFTIPAVLLSAAAMARTARSDSPGSRKLSFRSFVLALALAALQIFLWWLLYIIPQLGLIS